MSKDWYWSSDVFFFKQKTAYEMGLRLEFRRVLFRSYHALHLAQRPLALEHPEKSEPIGKYALMESTGGRYHIEVRAGMPRSAIRRIAHLLFVHAKTRPGAKLNILQNGKERTISLLKNISRQTLEAIIAKAVATGGGTFVVVHEKTGGALGSKFWRHPAITKLLSRRY